MFQLIWFSACRKAGNSFGAVVWIRVLMSSKMRLVGEKICSSIRCEMGRSSLLLLSMYVTVR